MGTALLQAFVIFAEPGFPAVDVSQDLIPIRDAIVATSVAELDEALRPGRVLVWRHGSAFPADAWPALVRFLEQGGSFLYLGGEPFTRPTWAGAEVTDDPRYYNANLIAHPYTQWEPRTPLSE